MQWLRASGRFHVFITPAWVFFGYSGFCSLSVCVCCLWWTAWRPVQGLDGWERLQPSVTLGSEDGWICYTVKPVTLKLVAAYLLSVVVHFVYWAYLLTLVPVAVQFSRIHSSDNALVFHTCSSVYMLQRLGPIPALSPSASVSCLNEVNGPDRLSSLHRFKLIGSVRSKLKFSSSQSNQVHLTG